MTETALAFLTNWFTRQCDGDWEHDLGVRIATLDNPGWALDVRIGGTSLAGVVADWNRVEESEHQWLHWRSTGEVFEARCGAGDLERALESFRSFAADHS